MKGKSRLIFRLVLIGIILAVGYWQRGKIQTPNSNSSASEKPTAVLKEVAFSSPETTSGAQKVGRYDKFTDARLLERDGNDGDSFFVKAGGREFEFRLYFVDAPEKYLSDRYENQRRRVAEQAREMGGVSSEQIVEVGKAAKLFTESQLSGKTFTIYTYWEQVYDGERYYGFVELPDGAFLGTKLVENGLARIHTKGPGSKQNPVPTPDGKSFFQHRDMLEARERQAKKARAGVWGI